MAKKKEDLEKLSVKDLREMVVKLGMSEEEAENFETKKPLIATIFVLEAQKAESPGQLKKDKDEHLSKSERMRVILMKQPRVRTLIPLEGDEKPGVVIWKYNKRTKRKEQVYVRGAYTPVQINGFKWLVPHGTYVDLPEQVAGMVSDSQNMTIQAGRDSLIDRDDPKTGGSVRDKLE